MLLGGLWHGASWTFVAWGGCSRPLADHASLAGWRWAIRFRDARVAKIWCRGASPSMYLPDLAALPRRELWPGGRNAASAWAPSGRGTSFASTALALLAFFVVPWMLYEAWQERRGQEEALLSLAWPWRALFYAALVLMMLFFPPPTVSEFIYFRF